MYSPNTASFANTTARFYVSAGTARQDGLHGISDKASSRCVPGSGQFSSSLRCLLALVIVLCVGTQLLAQPGADINNGIVRLGVNKDGSLIITPTVPPLNSAQFTPLVGIRYMPTNNDGSAGGLPVDGWGVADTITKKWGGALNGSQPNLAGIVQVATASTATCTVIANGIFQVTHDFHPSTHPNAYEITVTVKNISGATVAALYRRTIDWDIEPTATNEYVTIQGQTLSGIVSFTNDALTTPQNPLLPPLVWLDLRASFGESTYR
jgi:hypothetical protein